MSEMFSDNLNLSNKDQQSGFVTDVSPGLSLYGQSPWSNFNLNYRLQGLYNAGGRDAVDINHQLQMNTLYQAVRNTLFIQSSSTISQQNLSNAFIATDNLSGSGKRTEVKTFNISPYWTPHFGRFANGLFKVGYSKASFDNAQNNYQNSNLPSEFNLSNLISDSETYTKQASLSSGSYFNLINWGLSYTGNDNKRASGKDVSFESYSSNLRYFINRKFNVFAQGGYENNDFQSVTNSSKNGFYYTIGGQWKPSQFYSLEAGVGNNQHITVQLNPSPNLTSHITYGHKDVGLNRGSSWDSAFNYKIGQANWGFIYSQDTTTVQQQLIDQGLLVDPFGNPGAIPEQFDNPIYRPIFIDYALSRLGWTYMPNFIDDVIVVKRGNLNFGYQTGKSHFSASVFNMRRSYQQSALEDNVYGISGGWQWQLAPRLNFFLTPSWQSTSGIADNVRYDVSLGVSRPVPINLGRPLVANTRFELRHIEQMSDSSTFDFTENRATANFTVQF